MEIEKVDIQQFYIGYSYNLGVVQSPCTSKGFHYNLNDYKCSRTIPKDFPMLNNNNKRLIFAQAQLQEISILYDSLPKDLCFRTLPKDVPCISRTG